MSCSRVWFGADWRAAAVLAEAEQLRESTIDAAEFGRGRAELVGGHASGSVPFLTAPVRWARAARMAALSVGRGTSTVKLLPVALWVTTPRKAQLPTVKPGGRSHGGLVTLSRKVLDRCSRLAVTSSPSALAATK